jgi:hypothetical protein
MAGAATYGSRLCDQSRVAPPPCGLLMFLHIEKTGGSWIKMNLRRCHSCDLRACDFGTGSGWQDVSDNPCLYQRVQLEHWAPLLEGGHASHLPMPAGSDEHVRALRALARRRVECWPPGGRNASFRLPPRESSRIAIEYHAHNWQQWERIAPLLGPLRSLYRRSNCTFTVFTVLREPRAALLSFWNYFGHNRPLRTYAALGAERTLRVVLGRARSGPASWPPGQRNLSDPTGPPARCAHAALLAETAARLKDHFDVVGMFEHMDATLHRVAHLSGFRSFAPFVLSSDRRRSSHKKCAARLRLHGTQRPAHGIVPPAPSAGTNLQCSAHQTGGHARPTSPPSRHQQLRPRADPPSAANAPPVCGRTTCSRQRRRGRRCQNRRRRW